MPENNIEERFFWKGVALHQNDLVLKVGTDALLLATWVPTIVRDPKFILDVGTGSGVLAILMAKSFSSSSVIAIDPDENAIQLARLNINESHNQHRIHPGQTDLLTFAESTQQQFDLIISNPPFYVNHILPLTGSMQTAKHNTSSPGIWVKAMKRLVYDYGSVCLVVPTTLAFEWNKEANANELYCQHRMDIYSFAEDRQAKRSLLCYSHPLVKPKLDRMIMYGADKMYTEEYAAWLGI